MVTACDGHEALKALREHTLDLALLDYHMPGMIGPEVAEAYRKEESGQCLPIWALTATVLKQDKEHCL